MKKIDTIRALRDAEYRNSLTEAERAQLPAHPAGIASVSDEALSSVTGGCGWPFGTTPDFSCVPPGANCP
ncbi:MAG: mersacidin/lichenicidin family type 2 lantibiotic [Holophagales bacterium]|nr:mersacidin/lichenicidin family type 2 lantibiotic [Holophagales bacterium]